MEMNTNGLGQSEIILYNLGEIKAEIRAIRERLENKEREQDSVLSRHSKKIEEFENFKTKTRIYAGILAGVVSLVISLITKAVPWQNLF